MIKKLLLINIIFLFITSIMYANNGHKEHYIDILDKKIYVLDNLFKNENITIIFEKNTISGKSTVNKYNASFSLNDKDIQIKNVSTTKMAGPDNLMKIENEYLNMLSNAKNIDIKGNILSIKTKDHKELIFREKIDLSIHYLNGKEFTLKNAFNDSNITICFTKNHIYGYNNSNRYYSSYTINDDKISIKDLKIENGNENIEEDKYINLFNDVYKINLEGDNLILITRDKKKRLIYKMKF
ncbi:META domain-containing protein [Brachyspira alvinipulli]|uniref:META domain-containing protein n=1 Tax=Brachyspira alvinipulli TaxID=84379 RepID=UPI00048709EC|nr:META domain-containing protein [Brachyspira alvinipulli]